MSVSNGLGNLRNPGPDNILDTEDDIVTIDELHIEVGKVHHYKLSSKDVLHDFSVPVFRLKQDAVPGRVITGWFKPIKTGEFDIQCAEMCGIGHGIMAAKLYIHSKEDYAKWLASPNLKYTLYKDPATQEVAEPESGTQVIGNVEAEKKEEEEKEAKKQEAEKQDAAKQDPAEQGDAKQDPAEQGDAKQDPAKQGAEKQDPKKQEPKK